MPFLFLRDGNPLRHIRRPYVVYGLILFNLGVMLASEVVPGLWLRWGYTPQWPFLVGDSATLVTYQFVHSDGLHIFFNMLLLFVFGDNVEDSMGHLRFLLFYLLVGIGGALLFGLAELLTNDTPSTVIGASGAIGGVLAAYLLLHPRARVLVLVLGKFPIFAPSWIFIGLYVAFDVVMAISGDQSIAWWAHIGGFLTGLSLVRLFKYPDVPLYAEARFYPRTPFPELETSDADGKQPLWRRLAGGDYASRPPLTRAGAIKVFLLKTVSYLVLLLMLAIFADAFWTGLPKPPVQLIWFD